MSKKDRLKQRYWQSDLKPLGDFDKDGKSNVIDCFPFDPNRQGLTEIVKGVKTGVGKAKQKVTGFMEDRQAQKFEQDMKKTMYTYILVKYFDGPWQNVGAFTKDRIGNELKKYKGHPSIQYVTTSTDPNEADKLNRKMMIDKAKKQVKEKSQQFGKGVATVAHGLDEATQDAGFRQTRQNIARGFAEPQRTASTVINVGGATKSAVRSTTPPKSAGWWRNTQERVVDRSDYQGGQPFETHYTTEEPEMVRQQQEFEVEQRQQLQRMPPRRSREYQEQSTFGPGVVPYRPVSHEETALRNTTRKYRPVETPRVPNIQADFSMKRSPHIIFHKAQFRFVKRL